MPDEIEGAPVAPENEPTNNPTPPAETDPAAGDDGTDWKAMSRKHEREAKKARAEADELRTALMSDNERAIAEAKAAGRAEAMRETAGLTAAAQFRATAAEAGVSLGDAFDLIDTGKFISEDGTVDTDGISAAVAKLAAIAPPKPQTKPLAPTGAMGTPSAPGQLTRDDLKGMPPEAIVAAKAAGQLNEVLGVS